VEKLVHTAEGELKFEDPWQVGARVRLKLQQQVVGGYTGTITKSRFVPSYTTREVVEIARWDNGQTGGGYEISRLEIVNG
jgi:hypothetical protein